MLDQGDLEMLAKLIKSGTAAAVEENIRELLGPPVGAEVAAPPAPPPPVPRQPEPSRFVDPDEDPDGEDDIGRSPILRADDNGPPTADALLGSGCHLFRFPGLHPPRTIKSQ